jgi:uncharacterized protein
MLLVYHLDMIDRTIESELRRLVEQYQVVTITGPRQSGKTTLCRKVFPQLPYVNLESPDIRQFAVDDPRSFLARYREGVILDEIQRSPHLLSYIQTIVDEDRRPGRFVLTGSQQFEVFNAVSQTLAGRTALLKLLPLSMRELQGIGEPLSIDHLLLTGFYPRIYNEQLEPTRMLEDYVATYVERDLRQLATIKDLSLFERFLKLCAGRVGQILNMQSLAGDVGVSHTTVRAWLSLLEASYVVFLLPPWFSNISKRVVRSPKLYFYDVGVASYLLGLQTELHVSRDPLRGNLFENLVVMEVLKYRYNAGKRSNLYFYRDSGGKEVDLVVEVGPYLFPVEIKAGATVTADMFRGLKRFAGVVPELPLGSGLVYGGNEEQVRQGCRVSPYTRIHDLMAGVEG